MAYEGKPVLLSSEDRTRMRKMSDQIYDAGKFGPARCNIGGGGAHFAHLAHSGRTERRISMRALALACMTALALSSASAPSGAQIANNRLMQSQHTPQTLTTPVQYKDKRAAPGRYDDEWRDALRAASPRGPQTTTTTTTKTTTTTTTTTSPTESAGCVDNTEVIYRFPAKRSTTHTGNYWVVSNDHGTDSRDLIIKQWTGSAWTDKKDGAPSGSIENKDFLIWDTPIHAMADGEVIACWRNAPDNPDAGDSVHPFRVFCDDVPGGLPCTVPRSGNFVSIVTATGEILQSAHLKSGTIPEEICPHNEEFVADADADGVVGNFYEDIYIPPGQRPKVKARDWIGNGGNSGASGGPHLMIWRTWVTPCGAIPLRLTGARFQAPFNDEPGDVWAILAGPLAVETLDIIYDILLVCDGTTCD